MQIKSNTFLKSVLLLFVTTLSYINVNAQSRNVTIKSFNSIGVSSGIDLYLTQGTTESLTIKGDDDLIKDVVIEQNGTSLTIKYKDGINWGRLFKNQSIKVYVNFKSLKGLAASGGSDVYTQNAIKATDFTVAASGGSDLELNLTCTNFSLSISGGSDADLKGSAENMSVTATGGSDVDAYGFVANNAKVNTSGGSDVNINVNKGLEVNASGGSDVHFKGTAALKRTNSSKSSDVTHVN
jgi:hypothetical protein